VSDELLERLQKGEAGAIRQVQADVLPRLRAVCRTLLGQALADEVAEDVWTDFMVDHVSSLKHSAALPAYLRLMASRRCAELRRFQARHEAVDDGAPDGHEGAEAMLARLGEQRERESRLAACLAVLTESARAVLRMRFHHERTLEAIGATLGVSKQYVGRVVGKSLCALRRCLEAAR
jgi:RNA polymerase sigma factor (sigma-70 family)